MPPRPFAPELTADIKQSADTLDLPSMNVISDLGHDAVYFARVAPTAIVFVSCKDGISHKEIEDARADHLEAGCNVPPQVMLNAALKLERTRR